MSDMKCPFCQQELRNCCAGVIYTCSKPDSCPHEQCYGSKELWQELIRTRKALNVAVDALKEINDRYESEEQRGREEDDSPDWWDFSMDTGEILTKALEQIKTALEQKDVK